MLLKDKVAIVTGAGQGIGASVASTFAQQGAQVAVIDMNIKAAEQTAARIRDAGGSAEDFSCNVADRAQVDAMAAQVSARFGRVDILVNNAGITRPAMLHKMTEEKWQSVFNVHMNGSFHCLQAVVNGMIERKYGRIINVTSTAGLLGTIGQINYSAAKAGIVGLTMSAAKKRWHLRSNCAAADGYGKSDLCTCGS